MVRRFFCLELNLRCARISTVVVVAVIVVLVTRRQHAVLRLVLVHAFAAYGTSNGCSDDH